MPHGLRIALRRRYDFWCLEGYERCVSEDMTSVVVTQPAQEVANLQMVNGDRTDISGGAMTA